MLTVTSDWVTKAKCDAVLGEVDVHQGGQVPGPHDRLEIPGDALGQWTQRLTEMMLVQHRRLYGEALRPEFALFASLGIGDSHPFHADNVKCAADRWVPNHTPQRDFTSLLYLSDDFVGGEISHPFLGTVLKPRAGTLLTFPSDGHHSHAVAPITAGRRACLTLWTQLS